MAWIITLVMGSMVQGVTVSGPIAPKVPVTGPFFRWPDRMFPPEGPLQDLSFHITTSWESEKPAIPSKLFKMTTLPQSTRTRNTEQQVAIKEVGVIISCCLLVSLILQVVWYGILEYTSLGWPAQ
jgi:hypothetical protein